MAVGAPCGYCGGREDAERELSKVGAEGGPARAQWTGERFRCWAGREEGPAPRAGREGGARTKEMRAGKGPRARRVGCSRPAPRPPTPPPTWALVPGAPPPLLLAGSVSAPAPLPPACPPLLPPPARAAAVPAPSPPARPPGAALRPSPGTRAPGQGHHRPAPQRPRAQPSPDPHPAPPAPDPHPASPALDPSPGPPAKPRERAAPPGLPPAHTREIARMPGCKGGGSASSGSLSGSWRAQGRSETRSWA